MAVYNDLKSLKEALNDFCKDTPSLPKDDDEDDVPIENWTFTFGNLTGLLKNRAANSTDIALEKLEDCNPPIGSWNVADVTDFSAMFPSTKFNQDVSGWDVSKGADFAGMFESAVAFNQNLHDWVFKSGLNDDARNDMFKGATSFKQNLPSWENWDVTSEEVGDLCPSDATCTFKQIPEKGVLNTQVKKACDSGNPNDYFSDDYGLFKDFIFNENLTDMSGLFKGQKICDPDVARWDVNSVANFEGMFEDAKGFNQNLNHWEVSVNGLNFDNMFKGATSLRQWLISNEDGSNVQYWPARATAATGFCSDGAVCTYKPFPNLAGLKTEVSLYCGDEVDDLDVTYGPIEEWNINAQGSLADLFLGLDNCTANLARWDVSDVVNFSNMFSYATKFNSDLSAWNVAKGDDFTEMFEYASSFNANITGWDDDLKKGAGPTAGFMFHGASSFVQDLTPWPKEVREATGFCSGGAICDPKLFPSAAPSAAPTKSPVKQPTPNAAFSAGNDIVIFALVAMVVANFVR